MTNTEPDTEITLGTGKMLALFFTLVLVCAVFFAVGFSLGRKAGVTGAANPPAQNATPAMVVRPAAGKNNPPSQSSDQFSFYKAVEQKSADAQLAPPQDTKAPPAASTPAAAEPAKSAAEPVAAPSGNAYYVQVAAVTRQEDAEALVDALKKKQYPAFTTSNPSVDKFFHVQVGPFVDIKDAEAMRGKLVGDGYNPILKR